MKVESTQLPEVMIIRPPLFEDARGAFSEIWRADRYASLGVPDRFVQDNLSRSVRGTLRGLHFQYPKGQGKLLQVVEGSIFDVAVDVRRSSPRFGRWVGIELFPPTQIWVPMGFAHGFCVTSASATVLYKCTEAYAPECEHVLAWDDPALGIEWPIEKPLLSARDQHGLRLTALPLVP